MDDDHVFTEDDVLSDHGAAIEPHLRLILV
jgi:hypothetical protein